MGLKNNGSDNFGAILNFQRICSVETMIKSYKKM